jgi:hypothetical protein
MASKTNYAQIVTLSMLLLDNSVSFIPPTEIYVALFTTAPTDEYTSSVPTGVEVSGGSYQRQQITFTTPSGEPASMSNNSVVSFPQATAAWGVVVAFGFMDALTGGNLIYWANLSESIDVTLDYLTAFTTGTITVQEK